MPGTRCSPSSNSTGPSSASTPTSLPTSPTPGQAIGDPNIAMTLLAGIGEVDSAEPNFALWDLSRMVRASSDLTEIFDAGVPGGGR